MWDKVVLCKHLPWRQQQFVEKVTLYEQIPRSLVIKEHDRSANVVPGRRNISKISFRYFFVIS